MIIAGVGLIAVRDLSLNRRHTTERSATVCGVVVHLDSMSNGYVKPYINQILNVMSLFIIHMFLSFMLSCNFYMIRW